MNAPSFGKGGREQGAGRVAVLLCAELARLGEGLDIPEVLRWFGERDPTVTAHVLPDLCQRSEELARIVVGEGSSRVVLGLCSGKHEEGEVQVQLRKAGLDPLGLEVVNLGASCARLHPRRVGTEKAKILLAAAVARARAFSGSEPANAKPYLLSKLSRRALFAFPPLGYRAVPSVQKDRCVVEIGCSLCTQVCPYGALEVVDGQVKLEKSRCESCGLCVTACPREAILFPGYTPGQLEAQIRTLLDPAIGHIQPRGVLFTCRHANAPDGSWHEGWMPVSLPCVAMAPPTWFLAPLLLGAGAVGVLPYPDGCPTDHEEIVRGRVAFCQELLRLLGAPAELIRLSPDLGQPPGGNGKAHWRRWDPGEGASSLPAFSPHPSTMTSVLLRVVESYLPSEPLSPPRAAVSLEHPFSPLGVVKIQEEVCTGCGMCARVCPTGALVFEQTSEAVSLTFDAALCTACGQCLPVCPEAERGAIRVKRVLDLARLSRRKTQIYREEIKRCIACGAPIAPNRMLERVKALLGSEYAAMEGVLERYCSSCRGFRAGP